MPSRASRIPVLLKALVVETHMALRLRAMVGEEPLSIFIADAPLAPAALPDDAAPIRHRDDLLGHVRGGEKAALVADLLEVLAGMLAEQDALRHRLESVQEEVTRFYDLAAKTAGSNSPAEVCRIVVEEARRLFQGEDVSVSVRLHDGGLDLDGARCAAGSAVEPGEQTLSTMMSELMNIQGRVIGAINVASPTPGAFTRTDMRLLRALAAQAAAPIESARHQRRLQRILAAIERLNRYEDLETILDAVLLESRALTNADAGTIFLVEDGRLRFSYVHNDTLFRQDEANVERYRSYALPMDATSIVGYTASTGKTVAIDDAYALPPGVPYAFNRSFDDQHGYRTTSILSIPLHTHHGALVGVMQLINARDRQGRDIPFPQDLRAYLPLYAGNAAAALERAIMTRDRVLRMMKLAEMRDPHETGAHVQRVGAYAAELYARWARSRQLEEQHVQATRDLLRLAAMLHDVGKVGIPDAILKKPGRLTPEEFAVMQWHPIHGARLFQDAVAGLDRMCLDICLGHHERWDGGGYPGRWEELHRPALERQAPSMLQAAPRGVGVRGEEIPLPARIVALADVYDALSSRRCYKEAWPQDRVLDTIAQERGRQFDPELVDALFQILPLMDAIRARYRDNGEASEHGAPTD